MKRNVRRFFCIPAVFTMAFVTACGSSDSYVAGESMKAANTSFVQEDQGIYDYDYAYDDSYEEAEYESPAESGGSGVSQAEQVQDSGRKLIKNYSLEAETKDFANLIGKIEARVGALGGYVESCDTGVANYSKNTRYARYVIRIPKEKADSFVETVENCSNVTNKSENVEDVTLQYVDLESHRNALRTEQSRLLELLDRAESVEDIITVEQRLSDVRYQLESMESQLRTYDNKIDYSTIRLNISEVEEITKPEEETLGGRIKEGLADNFLELVESLVNFLVWLVTGLPYWILIAVFVVIAVLLVKICKKYAVKRKQKAWEKQQKKMQQYQAGGQPMPQNRAVAQEQPRETAEKKPEDKEKQQNE